MSPVGHSLVGATVGMLYAPRLESFSSKMAVVVGMVLLANLPDLPFPSWGHERYDISHSFPVGVCIVLVAILAIRLSPLRKSVVGTWPLLITGAAAVCSHYLLDSFYNHGKGVAIWWPISDARLVLPIPWFSHMHTDPLFTWHNVKVWGIEFIAYGTLSLVVLCAVSIWKRRS